MLPYASIASVLDDISRAKRGDKADLAARFLEDLPRDMLCPIVRLLTGELWPSWKQQEMNMGPESIVEALKEISTEDVELLRQRYGEMGLVADAALRHRSQHPISNEPLDAMAVYRNIHRISRQEGHDSDHRRGAILRGLFLEAEPLEGKYIVRTVMKSTLAGLGQQTMIAAISRAFHIEIDCIQKAYALMPEMGLVADAASTRSLGDIGILVSRPIRPMLIHAGEIPCPGIPRAYIPRYPGLRVQVHKADGNVFVYTTRLKNITSALSSLSLDLLEIDHDIVAEAELVIFQSNIMQTRADVVRFINRRHLSRHSKFSPSLVVSDLLYLDGRDLTGLKYRERRNRLKALLGEPKDLPFGGISLAEQRVLDDQMSVKEYLIWSECKGLMGLISRDLSAPYRPGTYSQSDYLLTCAENIVKAV
jgi:DNA ligase-1